MIAEAGFTSRVQLNEGRATSLTVPGTAVSGASNTSSGIFACQVRNWTVSAVTAMGNATSLASSVLAPAPTNTPSTETVSGADTLPYTARSAVTTPRLRKAISIVTT